MRNPLIRLSSAGLLLLTIAGCDGIDPLTRPYVWHETGVNVHNIAAQADTPDDLLRGRETNRRRAIEETDAVERLWTGHSVGLIGIGAGGSAPPVAAATPGAGGS